MGHTYELAEGRRPLCTHLRCSQCCEPERHALWVGLPGAEHCHCTQAQDGGKLQQVLTHRRIGCRREEWASLSYCAVKVVARDQLQLFTPVFCALPPPPQKTNSPEFRMSASPAFSPAPSNSR